MQKHAVTARVFGAVVDFLYPPRCLVCALSLADPGEGVCPACRDSIARIDPAHPVWRNSESTFVADGVVDGLHSMFLFEKQGALQHAIHMLKYGGMHLLGVRFGMDLGGSLAVSGRIPQFDVAIPVPLHGAKLRERGYNQSERICAGIRTVTGLPVACRALRRMRHTPSQTTLKLHEREENVRDAFVVPRGCADGIRGASILLVDDVLTTGATLRSCARALKGAGAGPVFCATVAIAE